MVLGFADDAVGSSAQDSDMDGVATCTFGPVMAPGCRVTLLLIAGKRATMAGCRDKVAVVKSRMWNAPVQGGIAGIEIVFSFTVAISADPHF